MSRGALPLAASLRFYRQHPLQLSLTVTGIALGAAVIVAVALATRAANLSFERSLAVLAGPMTHELRARDGALDETLYRELRLERGLRSAVPTITLRLSLGPRRVELIGTDPLALPPGSGAPVALGSNLRELLTAPGAVIAPAALAADLGLAAGESTGASIDGRAISLRLLETFEATAGDWLGNALLADIATVQTLGGRSGELDRIQLRLEDDEAAALREELPAGVELRAYADRSDTFDAMTRAFRTNLTAMSLLAVLVGAFLVYNAMTFAVVQRRPSFAVLRMVGVTARQLFRRLLLEAALLGLAGGVLGIVLGLLLGQSLLVLVAQTVSDLYVAIDPATPDIDILQLVAALAVTLAAVLAATLMPARDAARTPPASLERQSTEADGGGSPRLALAGAALVLACPLLIAISGQSLLAAFIALFLLVAGYALLAPLLLAVTLRAALALLGRRGGGAPRLVLRGVQSALPRTGPALVALAVAVSATVGVAIMIGSFRESVADWLDLTLQGDLYVFLEADGARLAPAWEQRLADLDGVAAVSAARQRTLTVDGEPLRALVLSEAAAAGRGFDLLQGDAPWAGADADAVMVSEPLATRRQLAVGARLTLATPDGPRRLAVSGIYRDYGSSWGAVVLPLARYGAHWPAGEISNIALALAAEADPAALRREILALGTAQGLDLSVTSNRAISERSLAIFDRTFVITDVLRALVVLVAFVGIVSALLALFLERRREFAVLRATGLTPRQLLALVLGQAATGGLLAGLLSLPLGAALSVLLIDVVNRRAFGWTLETHLDPAVAGQALALAVAAAALAALWPARRLAGADLRDALYAP